METYKDISYFKITNSLWNKNGLYTLGIMKEVSCDSL